MACSVGFAGICAGPKLAGLSTAKCPVIRPAKKLPRKFQCKSCLDPKLGIPYSSQLAPGDFALHYYGEGNALVVPVFDIRALVIPTVGFSLKLENTAPPYD